MAKLNKISPLDTLEDLPEELQAYVARSIRFTGPISTRDKLMECFKTYGNILSRAELVVAFYRLHGEFLTTGTMGTLITNSVKQGHIKHIGRSMYERVVVAATKPKAKPRTKKRA